MLPSGVESRTTTTAVATVIAALGIVEFGQQGVEETERRYRIE